MDQSALSSPSLADLVRLLTRLAEQVADLEAAQEVLAKELRRIDAHFDDADRHQAQLAHFRALQREARARIKEQIAQIGL